MASLENKKEEQKGLKGDEWRLSPMIHLPARRGRGERRETAEKTLSLSMCTPRVFSLAEKQGHSLSGKENLPARLLCVPAQAPRSAPFVSKTRQRRPESHGREKLARVAAI